jgi:hypothetical protein
MAILGWRDSIPAPLVKTALVCFALSAGLTAGWLGSGRLAALAVPAAVLAVINGYSKAYSP